MHFYSASGSWTPYYCVGLLTADANANLLDPASWKKHPIPVFQQKPENEALAPAAVLRLFTGWKGMLYALSCPSDTE